MIARSIGGGRGGDCSPITGRCAMPSERCGKAAPTRLIRPIFWTCSIRSTKDASIRSAMGLAHFVLAKSFVARAHANPKRPAFAAGDRNEACRHFDTSLDILQALKGSAGIAPNNLDPETVRKEMQGCPAHEPAVAATGAAASATR